MRGRLLAWLILGAVLAAVPAARAADAPVQAKPTVIAIVDVQRIMEESLAAKSASQQLEDRRSKFQKEIAAEETELREAEEKLAKSRETAPPEVFARQERQLRQRFLSVERHVQARRKSLDQTYTESINTVRKIIVRIVSEVSKLHGVRLAIVKQQVIWNDGSIDITDEVLTRLNKEAPKVEVKIVPEETIPSEDELLLSPKAVEKEAPVKKP